MKIIKNIGFLFLIVNLYSCDNFFNYDDEFLKCDSNCYKIKVTGKIIDKTTNIGIKEIPLILRWVDPNCFLCPDNNIDKKSSNELGVFSFDVFIDTSYFSNGYHLSLSASPENDDYIIFPWDRHYSINDISEEVIRDLNFDFYPKTQLQIEIERVGNDTFEYFSVEHYFRENSSYGDYVIQMIEIENNVIIETETAANIITYIKWGKKYAPEDRIYFIDSLICEKGKLNKYKIQY